MGRIDLRNMFHLYSKQVIAICLVIIFFSPVDAQKSKGTYNFLSFEQKPYYFGITLGYNTTNFKVFHSEKFILNDSIALAQSANGGGFNLGIVTNLKVGKYFDFRFLPTLSFIERNLNYTSPNESSKPFTQRIEGVLVETPFHIRYKSEVYNDMRMFVIAGVKYSFDVASDSRTRQAPSLVKIAPTDFAFEFGAGIQLFFPYFIFSPEIKFSHGLGNILIYDNNLERSNVLEKLVSRGLTISLHFEG